MNMMYGASERETTNAISLLICDGALGEFLFLTISLEALGCERLSMKERQTGQCSHLAIHSKTTTT